MKKAASFQHLQKKISCEATYVSELHWKWKWWEHSGLKAISFTTTAQNNDTGTPIQLHKTSAAA